MRHLEWIVLPLTLVTTLSWAGMSVTKEMECPVGGQKFKYESTVSLSKWGTRPDTKPYGSWYWPLALPVCPDNGLVVFTEFSAEAVKRLEPLVTSSDYQALVKADTPYYRAYWLQQKLDANDDAVPWLLLQASWEADGNPALKARYQGEFVDLAASRARPAAAVDLEKWVNVQALSVNSLRELGRYDAAQKELEALARFSAETPNADPKSPEALLRSNLLRYLDKIGKLIARRDASAEPLDMIPPREAARLCMDSPDLSKPEVKTVCESADVIRWKETYQRQSR